MRSTPDSTCPHLAGQEHTVMRLFRMPRPDGAIAFKCAVCALSDRRMLRRSVLIAIVVGSILILINQGPDLFKGDFSLNLAWKIPLTYLVPFCVASWGSLANVYLRRQRD